MFFIKISFILYLHIHNKRFYIFWQLLEFDWRVNNDGNRLSFSLSFRSVFPHFNLFDIFYDVGLFFPKSKVFPRVLAFSHNFHPSLMGNYYWGITTHFACWECGGGDGALCRFHNNGSEKKYHGNKNIGIKSGWKLMRRMEGVRKRAKMICGLFFRWILRARWITARRRKSIVKDFQRLSMRISCAVAWKIQALQLRYKSEHVDVFFRCLLR